jgi:hypothetical protein
MSVVIKVDTGFVGGVHEEDTGMTTEEWLGMSEKDRDSHVQEVLNDYCHAYAVDEDTDEPI